MSLGRVWPIALAIMVGCGRLGFSLQPAPAVVPPDAPLHDAGTNDAFDAAVEERPDAQSIEMDSSLPDAAAAAPDAETVHDAGEARDAAMQASMDDDAGSTTSTECAFTVTTNKYVGSPHYHGTLALQNTGVATWTLPTIAFDLPSSTYVCNDAAALPGAGWTLQSSAGHCSYVRTQPSLSIAPGATLSFEYSSNNTASQTEPAALNLSVSGCR